MSSLKTMVSVTVQLEKIKSANPVRAQLKNRFIMHLFNNYKDTDLSFRIIQNNQCGNNAWNPAAKP